MEPIEMFHIAHHSIEIIFSVFIVFAAYLAIKRFRLAIWKKGWYLLGAGGFIFALVEGWELLEILGFVEETAQMIVLVHTIHIIAFPLIAIGIFLLASKAGKIWGK